MQRMPLFFHSPAVQVFMVKSPWCPETIINLSDCHTCTSQNATPAQADELLTHAYFTQSLGRRPEPNFSIEIGTDLYSFYLKELTT